MSFDAGMPNKPKPPLRIAFMASNSGSSLRAIVQAIHDGKLRACACLVVSNKSTATAIDFAVANSIPSVCIPTQPDEDAADEALLKEFQNVKAELVILSGYLRKLGPRTLEAFEGRILNVHPALLPKFGGKGMYGRRVHQAVFDAGEVLTGATVHLADGEYDHGRVIAHQKVEITPADTVETIERNVMQAECALLVETVSRIIAGNLTLPL